MRTPQEVTRIISRNGGKILDNISMDEVATYHRLREEMHQDDVSQDEDFRVMFKDLYGLNRRSIGQQFRDRLFKFFEDIKTEERPNLREAFKALIAPQEKKLRHRQFSAITQMANTVDSRYPIYDKAAEDIFNIRRPTQSRLTSRDRYRAYLRKYREFRGAFAELLDNDEIKNIMAATRIKLKNAGYPLNKEKRLDLVLRSAGDLANQDALV